MDSTHEHCEWSRLEHAHVVKQSLDDDKLNDLPIDIRSHILSFLDTTDVVRTSLLSSKWRYMWTSVPRLNFNFETFWVQKHCLQFNHDECLSKFWEFIKQILRNREALPVYRVYFFCYDLFNVEKLDMLLHLCAMRHVEELDIHAGYTGKRCPFSNDFHKYDSEITHNLNRPIKLQSSTAFGSLKSLHLVRVWFTKADVTERLFSDCGFLENLSLEYCGFEMINMKVLKISAQKLRKLTIVNTSPPDLRYSTFTFRGKLKIDTPNLLSFHHIGTRPVCEFSNMPSLDHALIFLLHDPLSVTWSSEMGAMISGLDHAKELSLSYTFLVFFSLAFGKLRVNHVPFYHLRRLKVELMCTADHIEGLIKLLKLSPNLAVLRVEFIESWKKTSWESREEDVPCLSHRVKEVEITKFRESRSSWEFVKFFLQNAKSLKKMEIMQKKKQKIDPEKFHALGAVQLASKAISLSVMSISTSGKREKLQFVLKKWRVAVRRRLEKLRFNTKGPMRYQKSCYRKKPLLKLLKQLRAKHQ